ncbi:MAG: enoyl-CoA hydratase/isomerase family protein [Dehalococcoidia bacterium]
MPYQTIRLSKRDTIAYLHLQRPQQDNRIDAQLLQELASACAEINDDPQVRVAILSGGDAPAFSLGWDISLLAAEREAAQRREFLSYAFDCLPQLSQPVVCAINGDAISAGLELALACDVRLACADAHFALPETAWGLIPMGGGTQRLARIVGRGKALELILTAEAIDAQEAHRIGLVSQVVPRDRLMAEATALAERIAARGPIAVRYAKEAVSKGLDMTLEQALRFETDLTIILQTTEDRAEGVRAFLEKRPPDFSGR